MRKVADNEWNSSDSPLESETMESPLDVLSRAASMVETSSRPSGKYYGAHRSIYFSLSPSPIRSS
ncbi:unnamed protein product [Lymnaea stagnalis]|uniref:Uncharacterized protein n=1 Tax=Lymnaea stagnalis TaxID=6523 RepID=A0AAV2HLH5_LYMST